MKIAICVRTCTCDYNLFNLKRVVGDSKSDVTLRCLKSLLTAIQYAQHDITFAIHDDNSSAEDIKKMKELCESFNIDAQFIHTERRGNFKTQYEWLKQQDADFLYAVEDDYLHMPSAIADMVEMIQHMQEFLPGDYAVYPFNNPHRYNSPDMLYLSYVVKGPNQYWRSSLHSPHTFFVTKKTFNEFDDIMQHQAYTWPDPQCYEDNTINRVWREGGVRLLCPINSLAMHIEDVSQTEPFVDWYTLWKDNGV